MTFSEKLYKLRKEKGLSQEGLAEKLGTTRQAISKWENNQGFPETEKLLSIGNLFEVSIDYLLKDIESAEKDKDEKGYYVSREMAEGFLLHEKKQSKNIATGICIIILSVIPYVIFKESQTIMFFTIMMFGMIGIYFIISASFAEDNKYKVLKREILIF